MKYTLIANLKSYKTKIELKSWLDSLSHSLSSFNLDKFFIAPPAPYYYLFKDYPQFNLLAQDVSPFPPGSYTGAINVNQLKDFAIQGSLVGHSERRRYFHETNQDVINKIEILNDSQLLPVVCLSQNNLADQIKLISPSLHSSCFFAFEPVDAIGTGNPADPHVVKDVFDLIHQLTSANQLLYGGSITPQTASDYLSLPHFGGFLVGHAALDSQTLTQLVDLLS